MRRRGALLIALMLVGRAGGARAEQQDAFSVALSRVTLEVDGRTIAALPADTRLGEPGTVDLVTDRNRVFARDAATGEQRWVAEMPFGRRWVEVARDAKTAYGLFTQADVAALAEPATKSTGVNWVADGPDRVRRLSLAKGTWRPALSVEGRVRTVVVAGSDVVVVSDPEPGRVTFTCFAADGDAPRWSRSIRSPVPLGMQPGYFSQLPTGAVPEETTGAGVVAAGDVFVTCAGASQEIVALDRVDGSVRWQLDRLWEFDRYQERPNLFGWGFMRPPTDEARRDLARRCRIVAGPIVVGDGPGQRLFFGVTRDRLESTGSPVAESITYELSGGELVSITRLPTPVRREGSRALGAGVLWRCGEYAMAYQVPSEQTGGVFNGIGSSDRSGWLRWYRQPAPAPTPDAWLRTERGAACLVTDGTSAWFVVGGPYVLGAADAAFRIPLRRLDLVTGAEHDLVLVVPFTGALPTREKLNKTTERAGDRERIEILQPYAVEVQDLELRRGHLVVQLGAVNGGGRCTFRVEGVR